MSWRAMVMVECDLCSRCQLFTGTDPDGAYLDASADGWLVEDADDAADADGRDLCPDCAQLV